MYMKSARCNGNISVVSVFGAIFTTSLLFENLANNVSRLKVYFFSRGPVLANLGK